LSIPKTKVPARHIKTYAASFQVFSLTFDCKTLHTCLAADIVFYHPADSVGGAVRSHLFTTGSILQRKSVVKAFDPIGIQLKLSLLAEGPFL
jgi:hypothetical protein